MSKSKVENVRFIVAGGGTHAAWTVGEHRFHCWYRLGDGFDDTIYKNQLVPTDNRRRTVQLTREGSKATATMFDHVLASINAGDLINKALAEDKAENERFARINVAKAAMHAIEQQVLQAFRADDLDTLPALRETWRQHHEAILAEVVPS